MNLHEELRELMFKYHFRPEKKLSQFFCINQALLLFLASSAKIKKTDIVLEIGPGTGFLTKILLTKSKVVAIEKDELMFGLLSEEYKEEIKSGKLNLIHADALGVDWNKLKINKVVSLPPYHLSTDITNKIILSDIELAIIVFDSGFVEKITAFEGLKEYGALTAFLNINAEVESLEKISKASFFPRPNCQSEVIKLSFEKEEYSKEYFLFLKHLFRHKNKDLSRALKQALPFFEKELGMKKAVAKKFDTLEKSKKKLYLLSPEDLLDVFDELVE